MVYLQTPRVFHSLMELSLDPDTICLLSAENATLMTSFVWPTNLLVVVPLHRERTHESMQGSSQQVVIGGVGVHPPSCIAGIICIENLPRGHVDKIKYIWGSKVSRGSK